MLRTKKIALRAIENLIPVKCRAAGTGHRNLTLRGAALFMFCLTAAALSAQTRPIRELAPGVFYYFGDELQQKSANCVWVVFKDYVLAVDANYPWGAEEILGEIKKTTAKPVRFVFNTHYHHDHTFGDSVFVDAGAAVVSSRETAAEMRTLGQVEWDHNVVTAGEHTMQGHRREFPSILFDERMAFDDGEHRVELIKMGPAHTSGDSVAYLPKEKILVTGDLLVNGNPWGNNVGDQDADYDRWLTVLDTLASWDLKLVVPGHGEIGTAETLKEQRAYLADMLDQVRRGIQTGRTANQLVEEIDLKKHGVYGANTVSTIRSIRGMYRKLTAARQPAR
jgi:cyclase